MPLEYRYGLEPVTAYNRASIEALYLGHYGDDHPRSAMEVHDMLQGFALSNVLAYYITARTVAGDIAAAMGVLYHEHEDLFEFSHLVTHTDHRQKGLAKGILFKSVPLLKAIGAKTIRNHKRMNVIPSRYFEEMGFTEEPWEIPNLPEYKWRYTWTIGKE